MWNERAPSPLDFCLKKIIHQTQTPDTLFVIRSKKLSRLTVVVTVFVSFTPRSARVSAEGGASLTYFSTGIAVVVVVVVDAASTASPPRLSYGDISGAILGDLVE